MAPARTANTKEANPSRKRGGGGRGYGWSSDAPTNQHSRSDCEWRRQPSGTSETRTPEKRSVAESMKRSGDPSPLTEEKGRNGGRARDDVLSEIRLLTEGNSALEQVDFDYGVRQHLHAFLGQGGRQKLHDALEMIKTATAKKTRSSVKNWPAYLRKLLKGFGETLALKEREVREQACREQVAVIKAMACAGTGSDSTKTPSEELCGEDEDEAEAWMEALNKSLSDNDQWLNDLAIDPSVPAAPPPPQQAPPPAPPKESASPYPHRSPLSPPGLEQPRCAVQPFHQPPTQPPTQADWILSQLLTQGPPQHPPTMPPAVPPMMPSMMQTPPKVPPNMPPTPPPALPPTHQQARHATSSQDQGLLNLLFSQAPTEPPRFSPEPRFRAPFAQAPTLPPSHPTFLERQALQQAQQQHYYANWLADSRSSGEAAPAHSTPSKTLKFPIEDWAAFASPQKHVPAR